MGARATRVKRTRKSDDLPPNLAAQFSPSFFSPPKLRPRTQAQRHHVNALSNPVNDCVIAVGPAGSGKTYLGGVYAVQELVNLHIDKIVITRPAVPAGEDLGSLPGELDQKFMPYLSPYMDIFNTTMGKDFYRRAIYEGIIEICPIAFIQGRTFHRSIILFDEVQNASPQKVEMVLTRLGDDSRAFLSGDLRQQYSQGDNGLGDALSTLRDIMGIEIVRYGIEDCVRSDFCRRVLEAYEGAPQGSAALGL